MSKSLIFLDGEKSCISRLLQMASDVCLNSMLVVGCSLLSIVATVRKMNCQSASIMNMRVIFCGDLSICNLSNKWNGRSLGSCLNGYCH